MNDESIINSLECLAFFFERMAKHEQHNSHHQFDVLLHCRLTYMEASLMDLPVEVKLAALFHDLSKIYCYHVDSEGVYHYYKEVETENGIKKIRHEEESANLEGIWLVLKGLGLEDTTIQRARWYIRHHGDTIAPTKKALRRIMNKIIDEAIENKLECFMKENVWNIIKNLIKLQIADCKSKTVEPYEKDIDELRMCLRLLNEMSEENSKLHIQDLQITGTEIMSQMRLKEGPKVGKVLRYLFEMVKEGTLENTREALQQVVDQLYIDGYAKD